MDYIIRGIDKTKSFRVFGANTTDLVNIATKRHFTTPVASACLGRAMTGVAMMAQMEKNPTDRVSIIIKGDGPIGGIVVEANGMGDVKGYIYNPDVDIPKNKQGKLDVSGAIGNAVMTVMKDLGLKEPYIGQIAMLSGEIAEDLTYYFATSEQTNSMVALGVLVDTDYSIKHSAGIIIQVLPDAKEEAISDLEENLKSFTSLTECLEEGKKVEQVIEDLLGTFDIMEKTDLQFRCDCSKERMEKGLISLGKAELQDIVEDEQEDVELVCHFCNEKYNFDKKEIKEILTQL
ncbi:Hsp33 family molecular chaperone [Candidatus Epulonipiscium fishelsonii]|uniref:Hsp33 family molecular chaperone n=1 Tax=Candidatus Epulonipiscium fishelsonii TaxID=77094 RepID=A0ACC8XDR4_9FIRM|nr:Hsp33 family molecular chaperone [Epulopiscium sp. SCG-B11WGA-EpuloA1]